MAKHFGLSGHGKFASARFPFYFIAQWLCLVSIACDEHRVLCAKLLGVYFLLHCIALLLLLLWFGLHCHIQCYCHRTNVCLARICGVYCVHPFVHSFVPSIFPAFLFVEGENERRDRRDMYIYMLLSLFNSMEQRVENELNEME